MTIESTYAEFLSDAENLSDAEPSGSSLQPQSLLFKHGGRSGSSLQRRFRQVARYFRGTTYGQGMCIAIVIICLSVGFKLALAYHSRATTTLKCSACAQRYYTALACALGGQDPDGLADGRWLLRSDGWRAATASLAIGSSSRAALEELLASEVFVEAARCPRWAEWSNASTSGKYACVERTGRRGDVGACPRGPDGECTANIYEPGPTGGFAGGSCSCPDGEAYLVSDNRDLCGTLLCEGGIAGTCHPNGLPPEYRGYKAMCQPDFIGASQLGKVDPSSDGTCWDDGLPRFVVPWFIGNCLHDAHSPRVADMSMPTGIGELLNGNRFGSNAMPLAPTYSEFGSFYKAFYDSNAGDLCRRAFGPPRPGGALVPLGTVLAHPPPQPFEYVGCYVDDEDRDINHFVGGGRDVAQCADACKGSPFFAMQHSKECRCADSYATQTWYHKVDDRECGSIGECYHALTSPIASAYARCGGKFRNAVYKIVTA